jgi:hypothetical protein
MAISNLGEGNFEEGAAWARKALVQNARYTVAMRLLAANLANLGQVDAARESPHRHRFSTRKQNAVLTDRLSWPCYTC